MISLWAQVYRGERGAGKAKPKFLQHPQVWGEQRGCLQDGRAGRAGTPSQEKTRFPGERCGGWVIPAEKARR